MQERNLSSCIPSHRIGLVDRLGTLIPSKRFRELYFNEIFPLEGGLVASDEVLFFYQNLISNTQRSENPSVVSQIQFHSSFRKRRLTPFELGNIIWYYDSKNPNHISRYLTDDGNRRLLGNVAQKYREGDFRNFQVDPWREEAVLGVLDVYRSGETVPPVILTRRPWGARPDGHLHVIDGLHRLLALASYSLENSHIPKQEAFIA